MGIVDELKQSFKEGGYLVKLIYVNVGIFVLISIINVVFYIAFKKTPDEQPLIPWLSVPANPTTLLYRPWTLFTYMFFHYDFLHILFNMLWLFWLGRIFLEFLDQKKLLIVYLLGGLSGAFFYIIAFNLLPVFEPMVKMSFALGASASVLAIVVAVSFYVPNYPLQLMFIGRVKLKYIALFSIVLDIISIPVSNPGGHLAHLGGALFGFIFIERYKKKKYFTAGLENFMVSVFSLFSRKKKIKVAYKKPVSDMDYNYEKIKEQTEINRILDKISKGGYDSLTAKEKETLFKMSNKP